MDPPVLAWLSARDFSRARQAPGFSHWSSHREFLAERDALYVGYGAAGVLALRQRVPFQALERWSRLTGAPIDLDGADAFAAHWRWRRDRPTAQVVGRFGDPADPERNAIDAGGAQCVRVRPEIYLRWCDEFEKNGLIAAPSLDDYATHAVDCCLCPSARARRPTVSSS